MLTPKAVLRIAELLETGGGLEQPGLPIGLQVQGDYFAEAAILNVAHRFQQATDWHARRPPMGSEP